MGEDDGSSLVCAAAALVAAQMTSPTILHQRQLRGDVAKYAAALGRDAVVELLCSMVTRYAAESRDASARAGLAKLPAEKWTSAALDAAFQRAADAGNSVYARALEDVQRGGAGNARILADAAEAFVRAGGQAVLAIVASVTGGCQVLEPENRPPGGALTRGTPQWWEQKRNTVESDETQTSKSGSRMGDRDVKLMLGVRAFMQAASVRSSHQCDAFRMHESLCAKAKGATDAEIEDMAKLRTGARRQFVADWEDRYAGAIVEHVALQAAEVISRRGTPMGNLDNGEITQTSQLAGLSKPNTTQVPFTVRNVHFLELDDPVHDSLKNDLPTCYCAKGPFPLYGTAWSSLAEGATSTSHSHLRMPPIKSIEDSGAVQHRTAVSDGDLPRLLRVVAVDEHGEIELLFQTRTTRPDLLAAMPDVACVSGRVASMSGTPKSEVARYAEAGAADGSIASQAHICDFFMHDSIETCCRGKVAAGRVELPDGARFSRAPPAASSNKVRLGRVNIYRGQPTPWTGLPADPGTETETKGMCGILRRFLPLLSAFRNGGDNCGAIAAQSLEDLRRRRAASKALSKAEETDPPLRTTPPPPTAVDRSRLYDAAAFHRKRRAMTSAAPALSHQDLLPAAALDAMREIKVVWLVENPKSDDAESAMRYDAYKACETIGAFLDGGHRVADLQLDASCAFVRLEDGQGWAAHYQADGAVESTDKGEAAAAREGQDEDDAAGEAAAARKDEAVGKAAASHEATSGVPHVSVEFKNIDAAAACKGNEDDEDGEAAAAREGKDGEAATAGEGDDGAAASASASKYAAAAAASPMALNDDFPGAAAAAPKAGAAAAATKAGAAAARQETGTAAAARQDEAGNGATARDEKGSDAAAAREDEDGYELLGRELDKELRWVEALIARLPKQPTADAPTVPRRKKPAGARELDAAVLAELAASCPAGVDALLALLAKSLADVVQPPSTWVGAVSPSDLGQSIIASDQLSHSRIFSGALLMAKAVVADEMAGDDKEQLLHLYALLTSPINTHAMEHLLLHSVVVSLHHGWDYMGETYKNIRSLSCVGAESSKAGQYTRRKRKHVEIVRIAQGAALQIEFHRACAAALKEITRDGVVDAVAYFRLFEKFMTGDGGDVTGVEFRVLVEQFLIATLVTLLKDAVRQRDWELIIILQLALAPMMYQFRKYHYAYLVVDLACLATELSQRKLLEYLCRGLTTCLTAGEGNGVGVDEIQERQVLMAQTRIRGRVWYDPKQRASPVGRASPLAAFRRVSETRSGESAHPERAPRFASSDQLLEEKLKRVTGSVGALLKLPGNFERSALLGSKSSHRGGSTIKPDVDLLLQHFLRAGAAAHQPTRTGSVSHLTMLYLGVTSTYREKRLVRCLLTDLRFTFSPAPETEGMPVPDAITLAALALGIGPGAVLVAFSIGAPAGTGEWDVGESAAPFAHLRPRAMVDHRGDRTIVGHGAVIEPKQGADSETAFPETLLDLAGLAPPAGDDDWTAAPGKAAAPRPRPGLVMLLNESQQRMTDADRVFGTALALGKDEAETDDADAPGKIPVTTLAAGKAKKSAGIPPPVERLASLLDADNRQAPWPKVLTMAQSRIENYTVLREAHDLALAFSPASSPLTSAASSAAAALSDDPGVVAKKAVVTKLLLCTPRRWKRPRRCCSARSSG
ncbi:hypothetical protein M885DRAFT_500708 [Pelagophyceae sp. CCMP2097]|nr:hypothetical protein M885DRAFT_500708 [Pelagophyceae sp. CCMP2097]